MQQDKVRDYLLSCREMSAFCTQNGWIDNDSLEFECEPLNATALIASVKFTEVIMKGAGCEARRMPCFGRLALELDSDGSVVSSIVL